jgi:hypothetical protein
MGADEPFSQLCRVGAALEIDLVRLLGVSPRSWTALAAETLVRGSRWLWTGNARDSHATRQTRCVSGWCYSRGVSIGARP